MIYSKPHSNHRLQSRGVTLVELLVVVAIIGVLTAVMIPRLRVINKDRGIREAARVTASAFAKASNRAVNEGGAGLVLQSNANFIEPGTGVRFAATRMYQMRKLPSYTGDDYTSRATLGAGGAIQIPQPLEHQPTATPPKKIIKPFDTISFNGSSNRYLITAVGPPTGGFLDLTLDLAYAPAPAFGAAGVPFVVHRQPERLESSKLDLPEGHLIDLRFSGSVLTGANAGVGAVFNQPIDAGFPNAAQQADGFVRNDANEIVILFNQQGGMDRIFFYNNLTDVPPGNMPPTEGEIAGLIPLGTVYWFVSAYELNPNIEPIDQPYNMWVTVDHLTGSVNVADTVPATHTFDADGDGSLTLADEILEARGIALERQSAFQ